MPLTSEDRIAIADLSARLVHCSDKREVDAWLELYDGDGWLEANGKTLCRGRAEIADYIERAKTQPTRRRHFVSNVVIDDGDAPGEAQVRSYVAVYDVTEGVASAPYLIGEYDDIVTKASGRWTFKARRLTTVAGAPKAT